MTNYETKYLNIAKEIILRHIPKDEFAVFLFGSRASGKAHWASDIDIGIIGKQRLPSGVKLDLEDAIIESIVPYHVDFIDFSSVSEDFKKIALKHIQIWNQPPDININ